MKKTGSALRIKEYTNARLNTGEIAPRVFLDQFGRVMVKDSKGEWRPTGACGYAKH